MTALSVIRPLFNNTLNRAQIELPVLDGSVGNTERLTSLTQESKNILYQFTTTFPFDFFPDKIIIDENKINIFSKCFFFTYHVRSILISDITDISLDTGLFFATLTIIDSSNYRFPITETIRYISKENALEARRLIQGLILAKSKNITLSTLPISKVRKDVSALGDCQDKLFLRY